MISPIDFVEDFGRIAIKLCDIMDQKNITIAQMSRLVGIKYETVCKYYFGISCYFSFEILAKFCFVLNCSVSDILVYIPSKEGVKYKEFIESL